MTTETTTYPTLMLNEVIHIGNLNKEDKQSNSLEGAGLSVSVNPDEWKAIAKLGGRSWFRLTKEEGVFLDFRQLTAKHLKEIAHWGEKHGYIEKSTLFFYTWTDGETLDDMIVESTDYNNILAEADGETSEVQSKEGYKALYKLELATKHHSIPPFLALDLLATLFSETVLGFDGVWWEDRLDQWALSAPRGVINLTKLDEWTKTKIY